MKTKNKITIWEFLYEIYLFSIAITINLFFLIFVHHKYDYSPNLALFLATLPIIIIQFRKITKILKNETQVVKMKDD
jgi:hypothetical protein